jgi:hypothetical protein
VTRRCTPEQDAFHKSMASDSYLATSLVVFIPHTCRSIGNQTENSCNDNKSSRKMKMIWNSEIIGLGLNLFMLEEYISIAGYGLCPTHDNTC